MIYLHSDIKSINLNYCIIIYLQIKLSDIDGYYAKIRKSENQQTNKFLLTKQIK